MTSSGPEQEILLPFYSALPASSFLPQAQLLCACVCACSCQYGNAVGLQSLLNCVWEHSSRQHSLPQQHSELSIPLLNNLPSSHPSLCLPACLPPRLPVHSFAYSSVMPSTHVSCVCPLLSPSLPLSLSLSLSLPFFSPFVSFF